MTNTTHQDSDTKWDDSEFHQQPQHHWWKKHQRELMLFVGLLLALLIVVFWLPAVISPVNSPLTSAPQTNTTENSENSASVVSNSDSAALESPWQQAQTAKARREAQEILAKLLDKQNNLEKMQVNLWAKTAFAEAMAKASEGDEYYRAREFSEAQQSYHSTLEQFDALIEQSVSEFNQALAQGLTSIDQQKPQAAIDAYTLATMIRPHNQDARDGLARAQVQEEVILKLEQAENHQHQYQFSDAKSATEQALLLDPQSAQAKEKLAEIKIAMADASYATTMGQGYQELDQGRFNRAIKQFKQALKIRPADPSATDAIVQANNQRTQYSIQEALKNAQLQEQQERWQNAFENYQKAQSLDQSLVTARIGSLRSQARATLDQNLEKLINNPLRLADPSVYRSARALLIDARAVKPRGSRIKQQATQLAQALEKALDPIALMLRSDNQTEVTVYKVGALGLFTEHSLELKPGQYTVVGSRSGYRDVRQEITLQPGSHTQTLTIQCDEKIAIGG